jgi:hypothetical protein
MGQILVASSTVDPFLFLSAIRLGDRFDGAGQAGRKELNGFIRDDILYHLRGHQMPD